MKRIVFTTNSALWKRMSTTCVLALLICLVSLKSEAAILFQDNFNDGDTVGWTFIGSNQSNWNASGGVMHHGGGYDNSKAIALINGVTTPSVFTLEADVSVKSNKYGNPDWGHVGFAWGVNQVSNFNTSYLRTHQDLVTSWSAVNSSGSTEYTLSTPGTVNGPTYHLSVYVNSLTRVMTVSLDSYTTTFSGTAFDVINRNTGGGIGLMSWNDDITWDNVKLSSPVPIPAAVWLLGSGLVGLVGMRRKFSR